MALATKYDQVREELAEEKAAERKIQLKSVIDTIIAMAVLLGLLVLMRIPPVSPPMPEANGGMDIILGSDDVGMNDTKVGVMAGAPDNSAPAPAVQTSPEVSQPEVTQNNDPDAVDVKEQKTTTTKVTNPVPNPVTTKTTPNASTAPVQKSDPNKMFSSSSKSQNGHNGTGGPGFSKGTGNTPGDQGSKNGIPDGGWQKYGSGKEGTGPGFFLAGRGKVSLPNPNCNTQLEGKDIVQIVVDKTGNVIEAHGGYRGSTITDANAITCDEIAAKKAKFTAASDGTDRQMGSIQYIHKLH